MKSSYNVTYVFLIALVSAMGGLLFGYDWVVVGGAKIFYEPYFQLESSAALRGWAMSSALIGCLIGAVSAGMFSDRYGRKKMLIISAFLFTVSAVGTGAVHSFTWLIVYRIIGGLGIGMASNISPMYIAEVSPADMRGRFVSINQLTIVLGILAAQITNWLIGEHFTQSGEALNAYSIEWGWRWMFWAETVPAGLFFILAFFIPESPRWLVTQGKHDAAERIFDRIGGTAYATSELQAVKTTTGEKSSVGGFKMLMQRKMRNVLVLGVVLAAFQQWCGTNVIFNYAHEIFSAAGYSVSDTLFNIVVTGITNVVFTFVAIFTVDRIGRRVLMLIGAGGLCSIYLIMGICFFFELSGLPLLILVVLAIACYAMSLGPVTWVVLSEIFPNMVRGAAMAVGTFALWAACFVLTYTFPLLNAGLGAAGTFWIYTAICLGGFIFIWRKLPETKGKALEEIEKELVHE